MNQPDTILVAGDTHGNAEHLLYLYQTAYGAGADAIVQVGDFGYWEHADGGDAFLDMASQLSTDNDLPLFWIDGNHENHTMLRGLYGPGGERHQPTLEGFWEIRPGLYYIPRGTRWVWQGKHLMGLGGAYSVDKFYRLDNQRKMVAKEQKANEFRKQAGHPERPINWMKYQSWWPDEELDDVDLKRALEDDTALDILFTHDKPLMSNPPWNRKALDECLPNQTKIQTVVGRLTPKLLIHGHLHLRYDDEIRCGNDGKVTHVMGLNCDVDPRDPRSTERDPRDSWVMLKLSSS